MTIISNNYNFVFIHIPKCGGSSIEIEFERLAKWGDFVVGSTPQGYKLEKIFSDLFGVDKHTPPGKLKQILGDKWSQYKKVTIVRHPKKIIESYYKFGKRREKEICRNRKISRKELLEDISDERKFVPGWMFNQTKGVMIDAITSENFDQYLNKVADERWINFFDEYVFSHELDYVLKLENPLEIRSFFKNNIDENFELRHENISKSEKLIWNEDYLRKYEKLVSDVCNKLGYQFS